MWLEGNCLSFELYTRSELTQTRVVLNVQKQNKQKPIVSSVATNWSTHALEFSTNDLVLWGHCADDAEVATPERVATISGYTSTRWGGDSRPTTELKVAWSLGLLVKKLLGRSHHVINVESSALLCSWPSPSRSLSAGHIT